MADPRHDGDVDPVDNELLTVGDVCAWFKVSRDWVYDEVEAGRLPYLRLGRKHLRFRRADLHRYLRTSAHQSTPRTTRAHDAFALQDLEPLE